MELRDAVEADAERLAALTDTPQDVMRNLVHDRTVRVAEDDDITGFVSFDAREQTVYVTQLEGIPAVYEALLDEPMRFAESEGMDIELFTLQSETDLQEAVADAGFEKVGPGPRFEGEPTIRYRLESE